MKVYVILRFDSANHSTKIKVYGSRKKAEARLKESEEGRYESGVYFNLEKHEVE